MRSIIHITSFCNLDSLRRLRIVAFALKTLGLDEGAVVCMIAEVIRHISLAVLHLLVIRRISLLPWQGIRKLHLLHDCLSL